MNRIYKYYKESAYFIGFLCIWWFETRYIKFITALLIYLMPWFTYLIGSGGVIIFSTMLIIMDIILILGIAKP